ncbi:phage T7 F exclusion suppressor FxsA [compost metagenome]
MYKWLWVAILILPVVELWGILQVGDLIGGWTTFLLIVVMGLAGAYLALSEGRKVWAEAQRQMQSGQIPGRTMLDGLCVLIGGVMLLIPGFFSDVIGIMLLLPITRPVFRNWMLSWIEKRLRSGNFRIGRF